MLRRTALLTLIALAAAAGGCHGIPPVGATSPIPVHVRAVREPSDPGGARHSGTIEPKTRIELAFKVSGYVRELLQVKDSEGGVRRLQDGDRIAAGAVLAVVREGDYVQKVAEANAQLARAVADAKQAQIDFDRTNRLVASNAVAAAEADTASSRLAATQALVHGAEALVRDAQLVLDDTSLRSPIAGVVVKRGGRGRVVRSPRRAGVLRRGHEQSEVLLRRA